MAKRAFTRTELEAHLDEQLGFLDRSAAAFDAGYEDEAKRLAVILRVLLHDTTQSHSLLEQLGRKNRDFYDTAFDTNPASHGDLVSNPTGAGLVAVATGVDAAKYVALLDHAPWFKSLSFSAWWNAPVLVDRAGRKWTRKDLVLTAANQDGGAHVDPALDETYYKLSRENALGSITVDLVTGVVRPVEGPERAAIRQIAHEVLKTLRPDYAKVPTHNARFVIGGMSAQFTLTPATPTPAATHRVGRNNPCPCGSGKKYKDCHGRAR
jgi:hypothetical protein